MRIHLQHHPRICLTSTALVTAGAGCSLGVCNGCQLMALLGWVPGGAPGELADARQPRFVHNTSGRFESRWVTVRIEESPSVFLKVLALCSSHAMKMLSQCKRGCSVGVTAVFCVS